MSRNINLDESALAGDDFGSKCVDQYNAAVGQN